MQLTGAQIFIESLRKEGVKVIFGLPGGVNLPEFDALYDEKEIEMVLARHELGATHMAEGYARATGKPGVVLVTSGPGATNTITGLANANIDSTPLVVFTGQVSTNLIGNDAFQEADVMGISRPCTKHNFLVKDVNELAQTIKEAFVIATTGRPGPVLIDLPKNVVMDKADFKYPDKVYLRSYNPVYQGNKWQIKQAAEAIKKAKRPIIYAGGGVIASNAAEELKELVELTQMPVTMTLMGLGCFPGTHPLSLGMLGMHGTYWANMAIHNADLVFAIGPRFDDRVTGRVKDFIPYAKVIHIDIDPTSIRKNVNVDIPIVGDVKTVLTDLNKLLRAQGNGDHTAIRKPWFQQIEEWRSEHPLTFQQDADKIKPQFVIQKIYEATRGNAIVVTEVGQHQMWTAQFFLCNRPRTFITSGGLGTMGFGFPAALGVQKAFPDQLVIDIAGDGSIQMNLQELATAMDHNLPVKIAIINNHYHGMVRQWQQLFYKGRYSSSYLGTWPDYVKLAEAYGAVGLRATKPDEVEGVIQEGLKVHKPVLMDFHVDPMENCYPMIPAGAAINEMVFSDPVSPEKEGEKVPASGNKQDSILTS